MTRARIMPADGGRHPFGPGWAVLLKFVEDGVAPPRGPDGAPLPWTFGGEIVWARVSRKDPGPGGWWTAEVASDPLALSLKRGDEVGFQAGHVVESRRLPGLAAWLRRFFGGAA